MLASEVVNNFCAGIRLVAQNFSAEIFFQLVDNFGRKTFGVSRQRTLRNYPGDFPMTNRRVLALRSFAKSGERTARIFFTRIKIYSVDVEKSELREIRRVKIFRRGDCFERVGVVVAEIFCVVRAADAHAVQHD